MRRPLWALISSKVRDEQRRPLRLEGLGSAIALCGLVLLAALTVPYGGDGVDQLSLENRQGWISRHLIRQIACGDRKWVADAEFLQQIFGCDFVVREPRFRRRDVMSKELSREQFSSFVRAFAFASRKQSQQRRNDADASPYI